MCIKTSLVVRAPSGCQAYFSCGNLSARAMSFFSASSMERMISALTPAGAGAACAGVACTGALGARTASPKASVAAAKTLVMLVGRCVRGITISSWLPAREGASPPGHPLLPQRHGHVQGDGRHTSEPRKPLETGLAPQVTEAGNFTPLESVYTRDERETPSERNQPDQCGGLW